MNFAGPTKYLECGIFAHGFACARCDDCGHDYFVAFFGNNQILGRDGLDVINGGCLVKDTLHFRYGRPFLGTVDRPLNCHEFHRRRKHLRCDNARHGQDCTHKYQTDK